MTATLGACSGPKIALLAASLLLPALPATAQLMVVGNDEKVWWDDAGKVLNQAPGKDAVALYDLRTSAPTPKLLGSLPLENSIFGPPTNLAITPAGDLAIVA